jgi:hypothetical protein
VPSGRPGKGEQGDPGDSIRGSAAARSTSKADGCGTQSASMPSASAAAAGTRASRGRTGDS